MKHHGVNPCPNCNGMGTIKIFRAGVNIEIQCDNCDGTGDFDYANRRPIIQEEWIASTLADDVGE